MLKIYKPPSKSEELPFPLSPKTLCLGTLAEKFQRGEMTFPGQPGLQLAEPSLFFIWLFSLPWQVFQFC